MRRFEVEAEVCVAAPVDRPSDDLPRIGRGDVVYASIVAFFAWVILPDARARQWGRLRQRLGPRSAA